MSCSHNCSTCNENCKDRKEKQDFRLALNASSRVKKVIAIASGKGGVGKSLVTSLLACAAVKKRGLKVGILDADITGPSIPKAFGITGGTMQDERGILPSRSNLGIDVMSLNLLVQNPEDPVIWRGPVIAGAVGQFWTDVFWGEKDIIFIDMPPGTGDVPLTVYQSLPVDGVIIVASPQELVGMIVEKSVRMADTMKIPILGLVENMSYFVCSSCGEKMEVFGKSHVAEIAAKYGITTTSRIPIDSELAHAVDVGAIECFSQDWLESLVDTL